jgi:hypothetical protein
MFARLYGLHLFLCSGGFKIFDKPEQEVLQANYVCQYDEINKNVCVYYVHIYRLEGSPSDSGALPSVFGALGKVLNILSKAFILGKAFVECHTR